MTNNEYTDGGTNWDQPDPAHRVTSEITPDDRPSIVVVKTVAELTNTDVLDLEPLFTAIDPDHLDGLFADDYDSDRTLSFSYAGCAVTVTATTVSVSLEEGEQTT